MRRPKPSGSITITTDFGRRDPYVGSLKGVIHSIAPLERSVLGALDFLI